VTDARRAGSSVEAKERSERQSGRREARRVSVETWTNERKEQKRRAGDGTGRQAKEGTGGGRSERWRRRGVSTKKERKKRSQLKSTFTA
jgi:hypothetical protein